MVGLKAQIDVEQAIKALSEKTSADQKHHRQRQLDNNEVRAEPAPDCSRGSTTSFAKTISEFTQWQANHRSDREQDGVQQCNRRSEDENVQTQSRTLQVRHAQCFVWRNQFREQLH